MVRTPFPAVVRLCGIAAVLWPQLESAYYQTNLLKRRPHSLLNLVYSWYVERLPHDKYDEWHVELVDLLEWQNADSEAAAELESESFLAFAGMSGNGG